MKALVLVDVQRDFMPGGGLPVENGDRIVPVINRILGQYPLVAATQDWHPPGHQSFASSHPGHDPMNTIELNGLEQILWPDHCVQGTDGAGFHEGLNMNPVAAIFRKGTDPAVDSYSGFHDNGHRHRTGLAEWLRGMGIDEVHLAGLAAEVCVGYTARDAAELGFKVAVIEDAVMALSEEAYAATKVELGQLGVRFISAPS